MVKDSSPNGYFLKNDFQMSDKDATFIECRTPKNKNNNKILNLGAVDLGRKYTYQLLISETKLTHINEQVSEAQYGVTRTEPETGEMNWTKELLHEQEKIRLLIPQKVQDEKVTESEVCEEDVEEVSDDMYAYTREDFKVTSVKRKDVANIETANESEYDTDDPDNIL